MQNLVIDTNILGQLCHPSAQKFKDLKQWAYHILLNHVDKYTLCLPEISDYELRRKLMHIALKHGQSTSNSLQRLEQYIEILNYLPLNTGVLRNAAVLWAESKFKGEPTASMDALDGDVILAAQAKSCHGIVITLNKKHLSRFVPVADWKSFTD